MPAVNKGIIMAAVIFLISFSIMQFTVPNIIGFDGYYNIKAADLIRKEGLTKEFTWIENSILSKNYADLQILFKLILVPFTFLGLEKGAKIAAVLFAAAAFVIFYWFLIKNRIRYPFFWTVLYLFTAESLMLRFMLPRQMPLVVSLLVLTVYFLQRKKYVHLGLTSFVFMLLHGSFVFQLFLVVFYFILEKIFSKKWDYKLLLYPLIGFIAALIINPYFPNNIYSLYIQIFKVNLTANLFNVEWKPWPFIGFLKNNILVFIYLAASLLILFRTKKITKDKALFLSMAIFFFVYTIISRRMQEFLIPFSVLTAAFFFSDYLIKIEPKKFFKYLKISAIIFLFALAAVNFMLLRNDVLNNNFLHNYEDCAKWLTSNAKKNSLVFINAYAFPYLFFMNSEIRYTHGLDLTYSYLYDGDKFQRYMGILQGSQENKNDFIISDYRPDYVFSGKVKQDVQLFNYVVAHKENYRVVYEDEWCAVLEVR